MLINNLKTFDQSQLFSVFADLIRNNDSVASTFVKASPVPRTGKTCLLCQTQFDPRYNDKMHARSTTFGVKITSVEIVQFVMNMIAATVQCVVVRIVFLGFVVGLFIRVCGAMKALTSGKKCVVPIPGSVVKLRF